MDAVEPSDFEAFIDQISTLAARGHVAFATELVEAVRAADPLRYYLGHAHIAAAQQDAGRAMSFAMTAAHYAPDDARVARALALAHLVGGDRANGEEAARRAVRLDNGPLSWLGLARVLGATGHSQAAEQSLRELLSRVDEPDARLALAGLKAARGDQAGAIADLASVLATQPSDPRPVQQAVALYREAGWMLGVVMLTRVTRGGAHAPEVKVLLDLIALEMLRVIDRSPLRDIINVSYEAAQAIVTESASFTVKAQLELARKLVEVGRTLEPLAIVARVSAAPLAPTEQAEADYVRGLVHDRTGATDQALASYLAACAARPDHWEAACNAIPLCVRRGDAASLETANALVAGVPLVTRRLHPELTFNEALCLSRSGRSAEARRLLAFLAEAPLGALAAPVAALARDLDAAEPV